MPLINTHFADANIDRRGKIMKNTAFNIYTLNGNRQETIAILLNNFI